MMRIAQAHGELKNLLQTLIELDATLLSCTPLLFHYCFDKILGNIRHVTVIVIQHQKNEFFATNVASSIATVRVFHLSLL